MIDCAGFIRAYGEARGAIVEAVECLSLFPPSPYRDVLTDLAYYVVDQGAAALDPGPLS
ncbi:MAG TPA: hypothetical protein VMV07_16170 [Streptosporangiaceae bacterium]|nr:hypothetical protein [Streptosporangiaceae bacterium]